MGFFLENVFDNDLCNQILDSAKEKLGETKLGGIMEELGVDTDDLGKVAKGVINVIGVARTSVSDDEEAEEETDEEVDEEMDEEEEDLISDEEVVLDGSDEEEEEYEEEEETEEEEYEEDETDGEPAEPSKGMKIARFIIQILKKLLRKD